MSRCCPISIFVLAVSFILFFRPVILSDGAFYHGYLPSLLIDHDLNTINQVAVNPRSWPSDNLTKLTEKGYDGNIFPFGPALSWLPGFLTGQAACRLLQYAKMDYYLDGYDYPCRYFTFLMSSLWVAAGIFLIHRMIAHMFDRRWIDTAIAFFFIGTPLLNYTLLEPDYSHHFDFFIIAWLCLMIMKSDFANWKPSHFFLFGLGGSFVILTRLQNAGWVMIPPLMFLIAFLKEKSIRRLAGSILPYAAGFVIGFCPQMIVNFTIRGSMFMHGYETGYFDLSRFHMAEVLFSLRRGLFVWHPILFISVLGFFFVPRLRHTRIPYLLLGPLSVVVISSTTCDWFGGGCFGARRMIGSIPVAAIGLTALFSKSTRSLRFALLVILSVVSLWNIILLFHYHEERIQVDNMVFEVINDHNLDDMYGALKTTFQKGLLFQIYQMISEPATPAGYKILGLFVFLLVPVVLASGIWKFMIWTVQTGGMARLVKRHASGINGIVVFLVILLSSVFYHCDRHSRHTGILDLRTGAVFQARISRWPHLPSGYGVVTLPWTDLIPADSTLGPVDPEALRKEYKMPLCRDISTDCLYLLLGAETLDGLVSNPYSWTLDLIPPAGDPDPVSLVLTSNPVFRRVEFRNGLNPLGQADRDKAGWIRLKLDRIMAIHAMRLHSDQPAPPPCQVLGIAFDFSESVDPDFNAQAARDHLDRFRMPLQMKCPEQAIRDRIPIDISIQNKGPTRPADLILMLHMVDRSALFFDLNGNRRSLSAAPVRLILPGAASVRIVRDIPSTGKIYPEETPGILYVSLTEPGKMRKLTSNIGECRL